MDGVMWHLVVPVKGGDRAKSRLGRAGAARSTLARAIGLDCVDAAVRCPRAASVLVVTSDDAVAHEARAMGALAVPESARGAGLLAAVADGLAEVPAGPVAVLLGDLPALRPDDLAAGLDACSEALAAGAPAAAVADAEGTGTVLLAAGRPEHLRPRFGAESAAAHRLDGAVLLDVDLPRLRRDVDTAEALAEALRLGVGPRTSSAVRRFTTVSSA